MRETCPINYIYLNVYKKMINTSFSYRHSSKILLQSVVYLSILYHIFWKRNQKTDKSLMKPFILNNLPSLHKNAD